MKRPDPAQLRRQRTMLIREQVRGRASASSTSLSRSFGLPVADVSRILRNLGVKDDG